MEKKNDFKPFISADKVLPEFTVTSVILGMILAVIFGGANAYLGLRVGMTVSASIPAAVISMGVIRVILKKIPSLKITWYRQLVQQVNH
jgi:TIGR00733: oligopeptide transporter, OPT family